MQAHSPIKGPLPHRQAASSFGHSLEIAKQTGVKWGGENRKQTLPVSPHFWRRLFKVPWTARSSDQSLLKEINPEYSLRTDAEAEAPIPWPPDMKSQLIGKDPDAGKDWGQDKGVTEDEMVGWHHLLNEHEFEQTPGDSEGQGSLVCCSLWDHRVGHNLAPKQQW